MKIYIPAPEVIASMLIAMGFAVLIMIIVYLIRRKEYEQNERNKRNEKNNGNEPD